MSFLSALISACMSALCLHAAVHAQATKSGDVVKAGSTVSLEYTLFDERGAVIETNKGAQRLTHTQSRGQMVPGVERALEGMRVGQQKTVKLQPEEAYGRVNPAAFHEVPKDRIPAELLKPGAKLLGHTERQAVPARVHEIKQKTVVLDFNHPLAGKPVTVVVKVLDVVPFEKLRPPVP